MLYYIHKSNKEYALWINITHNNHFEHFVYSDSQDSYDMAMDFQFRGKQLNAVKLVHGYKKC